MSGISSVSQVGCSHTQSFPLSLVSTNLFPFLPSHQSDEWPFQHIVHSKKNNRKRDEEESLSEDPLFSLDYSLTIEAESGAIQWERKFFFSFLLGYSLNRCPNSVQPGIISLLIPLKSMRQSGLGMREWYKSYYQLTPLRGEFIPFSYQWTS